MAERLRQRVKIHREGTAVLTVLALTLTAVNALAWIYLPPLLLPLICTIVSLVCYGFVFNFFRCPNRHYRGPRKDMVISSVDGRVVVIEQVMEMEYIKGPALQISVFMSPLNVHANWYPVQGQVQYVRHHRGRFLSAYLPKSSTENERSTIGILADGGQYVTARQIAGAMARRIVTYARKGNPADIEAHMGFIKFGSRVDIYLPPDSTPLVAIGDTVRGCITPIARMTPVKKH